MTQLERRIDALEAVTGPDKVTLLFITWLKPKGEPPRRMMTEWNGEHFSQALSEPEESFLDRVRWAVERDPPAANNIATVFLQGVDWGSDRVDEYGVACT